jgi:hypothetical protein
MQRTGGVLLSARMKLLIFILSILAALANLAIAFAIEDRWGHEAFVRWDGLAGFTLGLFGLFVADSEKFIRKQRFWELNVILFLIHCVVFTIVLINVETWRLTWFMVMIIEYPFFLLLREKFVH